jgi:hypothetical protein
MHIAPTGFPGHLSDYLFFSGNPPRDSDQLGTGSSAPCRSVALDPDQSLDDIFNRLKLCKAALGYDAMRWTIGLFKHCVGFRVFCYPISHWWDWAHTIRQKRTFLKRSVVPKRPSGVYVAAGGHSIELCF